MTYRLYENDSNGVLRLATRMCVSIQTSVDVCVPQWRVYVCAHSVGSSLFISRTTTDMNNVLNRGKRNTSKETSGQQDFLNAKLIEITYWIFREIISRAVSSKDVARIRDVVELLFRHGVRWRKGSVMKLSPKQPSQRQIKRESLQSGIECGSCRFQHYRSCAFECQWYRMQLFSSIFDRFLLARDHFSLLTSVVIKHKCCPTCYVHSCRVSCPWETSFWTMCPIGYAFEALTPTHIYQRGLHVYSTGIGIVFLHRCYFSYCTLTSFVSWSMWDCICYR